MISTTAAPVSDSVLERTSSELTSWLQARSANKEPIDITLRGQIAAVLLAHTTTIDDSSFLRYFRRHRFGQPLADGGMDFLCLFYIVAVSAPEIQVCGEGKVWEMASIDSRHTGCGNLAGTNCPNRLIRNNNLLPLFLVNRLVHRLQLLRHDLNRGPLLPLLQALTTAQNNTNTALDSSQRLLGNELVLFSQDRSTLRVSEQCPCDV